jgi:hypothetical protein
MTEVVDQALSRVIDRNADFFLHRELEIYSPNNDRVSHAFYVDVKKLAEDHGLKLARMSWSLDFIAPEGEAYLVTCSVYDTPFIRVGIAGQEQSKVEGLQLQFKKELKKSLREARHAAFDKFFSGRVLVATWVIASGLIITGISYALGWT